MITNRKGFSSFQIVFGRNPNIPGITNGNNSSLNTTFTSPDVRKHIERLQRAREAFATADSDNRIKRALKSRIPRHNNHVYQVADKIFFKEEESNEWH